MAERTSHGSRLAGLCLGIFILAGCESSGEPAPELPDAGGYDSQTTATFESRLRTIEATLPLDGSDTHEMYADCAELHEEAVLISGGCFGGRLNIDLYMSGADEQRWYCGWTNPNGATLTPMTARAICLLPEGADALDAGP